MWAGRPFFIRIGVSQASDAPASSRRCRIRRPQPRVEVVDVGLVDAAACALAWLLVRGADEDADDVGVGGEVLRAAAPVPTWSTSISGCGPQLVTQCASSAAPVGVQSSAAAGPAYVGMPRSSSTTAGGGTLSWPWAVATVPEPTATGLQWTRRGRGARSRRRLRRCRRSRRAHRPRGSAPRRRLTPWTAASARPSRLKTSMRVPLDVGLRRRALDQADDVASPRWRGGLRDLDLVRGWPSSSRAARARWRRLVARAPRPRSRVG